MNHDEAKRIIGLRVPDSKGLRDYTCPECKQGRYHGIFAYSCDNPGCKLYDRFTMERCGICGQPRRSCSC